MSSFIDGGSYFNNSRLNRIAYFPDKAVAALYGCLLIVAAILFQVIVSKASAYAYILTLALLILIAALGVLVSYATKRRQNAEDTVLYSLAADYYAVTSPADESYSLIDTTETELVKHRLRKLSDYVDQMRRNKQVVSRPSFDEWYIVNS